MCEITNGKIYVADRDIVCYKVVLEKGNILESVHQGYEYKIGQEYCISGFEYKCCLTEDIYEVWRRSISPFAGWGKIYTIYPNMYFDRINTGLQYTRCGFYSYAYYRNDRMECDIKENRMIYAIYGSDRLKCVRCRIPKGSKYMVSDNGEVFISERIVIDDAWSLEDEREI